MAGERVGAIEVDRPPVRPLAAEKKVECVRSGLLPDAADGDDGCKSKGGQIVNPSALRDAVCLDRGIHAFG